MSRNSKRSTRTLAELQEDPRRVLKHLPKARGTIFLTEEDEPVGVLMDMATFERLKETIRLARLLGEAEADVRAGRVRPIEEFFAELDGATRVSGKDHKRRRA